ncbi:MAG: hypothetical protein HY810_04180 [Candidatus Omnitrophica bacterium]|nr:hypothetical protein [Candidatus Omnitrophota bacterium]
MQKSGKIFNTNKIISIALVQALLFAVPLWAENSLIDEKDGLCTLSPDIHLEVNVFKAVYQQAVNLLRKKSIVEQLSKESLFREAILKSRADSGRVKLERLVIKLFARKANAEEESILIKKNEAASLLGRLMKKEMITKKGTVISLSDLFRAVAELSDSYSQDKKDMFYYLIRTLNEKEIFDNEYTALDISRMLVSFSGPERFEAEQELVNLIISVAEDNLAENKIADFLNEVLPAYRLSIENEEKIIRILNLKERAAREGIIKSENGFAQAVSSLRNSNFYYAGEALKNIIVYARINPLFAEKTLDDKKMSKQRILKESIRNVISTVKGSYRLYPLLRQTVKDTFYLSSSKMEEIDRLCRIAEREVNVSTHKGQDLYNPLHLLRILKDNHQRRGNSPEVTKALKRLLEITRELSNEKKEMISESELAGVADSKIRDSIKQANADFKKGRKLEAVVMLTKLRQQIYLKIISKMQEAEKANFKDIRRWGTHMDRAEQSSQTALTLMEIDLLLEQKINDYSGDLLKEVTDKLAASQNGRLISQAMLAVYVIAKNAALSGLGDKGLSVYADYLLVMSEANGYGQLDLCRIYGFIHQIRLLIEKEIVSLSEDYTWRVAALISDEQQENPQTLGFVQDFLTATTIRQFGERIIMSIEQNFKNLIEKDETVSGFQLDPVMLEQTAARIEPHFGKEKGDVIWLEDGKGIDVSTIGDKAAGLSMMLGKHFNVPPGFIVIGDKNEKKLPKYLSDKIKAQIRVFEKKTGKKINDSKNPLILSLRATFPVPMPGIFPTVTNFGMNDKTMEALAKRYNRKFALSCYVRFLRSYYEAMDDNFDQLDYPFIPKDASVQEMEEILLFYKTAAFLNGIKVPDDPYEQIENIISKITYHPMRGKVALSCALHGIPSDWLVNVVVQEMKFGNLENSYTAVVHTRNTLDGSPELEANVLYGGQGEDLVTPKGEVITENVLPVDDAVFLKNVSVILEKEFQGPVELEITNQEGEIFFLQARIAKLHSHASKRALLDMAQEGIMSEAEALKRIKKEQTEELPAVSAKERHFAEGLGISGGAISGPIALTIEKAMEFTKAGRNSVLVLMTTPARDIQDRYAKQIGVLTVHGTSSTHYAEWCRKLNRPYISMVEMSIDIDKRTINLGGKILTEGDVLTIDGINGKIFEGEKEIINKAGIQGEGDFSEQPAHLRDINKVKDKIVEVLGKDYEADIDHGVTHAQDLIEKAVNLAGKLQVTDKIDWKVLTAAICLHDIGSAQELHGQESAAFAKDLLTEIGILDNAQIRKVEEAIILHEIRTDNASTMRKQAGLEAQFLYDIDVWDAFGIKGIYRYIAIYLKRGKDLNHIKVEVIKNVKKRFKTITFKQTKNLARDDFKISRSFFEQLSREKYKQDFRLGATGVVCYIRQYLQEHPAWAAYQVIRQLESEVSVKDNPAYNFIYYYFRDLETAYRASQVFSIMPESFIKDRIPKIAAEAKKQTALKLTVIEEAI